MATKKPILITNGKAQTKLVDAMKAMHATNQTDWYLQTITIVGMCHEEWEGSVSRVDGDPAAVKAGTDMLRALNLMAIRYPADWAARVNRFMLLVDIEMRGDR